MSLKHIALVLEDSHFFRGNLIGELPLQGAIGEIIFNTSMSGYQEVITDPSYKNQIVCFTYPSIGNYGINPLDNESDEPYLSGIVLKEHCEYPSNYQSVESLEVFLKKKSIPGIVGVDTRKLVRHIREKGSLRAGIFYSSDNGKSEASASDTKWLDECIRIVQASEPIEGQNLVAEFNGNYINKFCKYNEYLISKDRMQYDLWPRVAILDFGTKLAIVNSFLENHIYPVGFPGDTIWTEWSDFNENEFDGFFLSNGPGDPAMVKNGIQNAHYLLTLKKPIFGICLGHQILSIALGSSTFKMKFGHHGSNQPVAASKENSVWITPQNHGFAVDDAFMRSNLKDIDDFQLNLNDKTAEGFFLYNEDMKLISVQYHPEASPGPHDARILFQKFKKMLEK